MAQRGLARFFGGMVFGGRPKFRLHSSTVFSSFEELVVQVAIEMV